MLKTEREWIDRMGKPPFAAERSRNERLETATGIWTSGRAVWNFDKREALLYDEELTLKIISETPHSKINLMHYYVTNHSRVNKHVKLLSMHFQKKVHNDHFAFISPADDKVFHLSGKHMFMVDGISPIGCKWEATVLPSWLSNLDSIWGNKEKGHLKYSPTAKGNPSSIHSLNLTIPSGCTVRASSWTIAGYNKNGLLALNEALLKNRLAFPKE